MEYTIPHNIEDIVYLKTGGDQKKFMVTGINIRKDGIKLEVSNNGYVSEVFEFEVSDRKNIMIKLGIDG